MKVAAKLSGAFGLLVLLFGLTLVYHVRTTRHAVTMGFELAGVFARLEMTAAQQLDDLDRLEETASKYWITGDERYRARFHEIMDAIDGSLRRIAGMPLEGREREEFARLEALWRALPVRVFLFEAAVSGGDRDGGAAELDRLQQDLTALRLQARRLGGASREGIRRRLDSSADAARDAERVSVAVALVTLLLSVLIATLIVRSITESLRLLQHGTREVAGGNFAYRIETKRKDEFAQLARAFNRMTEHLGELDRMKRDFLSNVSHDLKTPLASMQETSRILLDGVPGAITPKQRRLLELNLQSGQRLSAMIAKILDLSAIEAGSPLAEVRRQDLLPLVRHAAEVAASALAEGQLRIHLDLPDHPVLADCDAERIARVLDNLLENAAKFSPQGGTIGVRVRLLQSRPDDIDAARWRRLELHNGESAALISVSDEGPGVPVADRERIFERFYQSAGARRTRNRGVGLGLAICRELVEAHGGAIWVQENEPRGSIFHVALRGAGAGIAQPHFTPARGSR